MKPRWHAFLLLFLARVREFYRQPTVVLWAYGFPLFLAVGLGFAFAGGLSGGLGAGSSSRLVIAVADDEHPQEAATLADHLKDAGIAVDRASQTACRNELRAGRVALLVIPGTGGYEYVYDPQRPDSLVARYRVGELVERWKSGKASWPSQDEVVREPGSRYIDYLIPGLMGLNLMAGGLWGIGFVVVDFRVRKLLKLLLATPMRRSDFLLAIISSRLLLLVPEMLLLALVGMVGFGMPMRGHIATLTLVVLVGGAAFAGLGLLAACRLERTETMTGIINLVMLPLWMFSGTFFSPDRFPEWLRPLTHASPLTPLNDALRRVVLEGATLGSVASNLSILVAWAVITFVLALAWFRWH